MNMKYCKRCLFPDTKPDIYFDENGICDACHSADRKHGLLNAINWEQRALDFEQILKDYRSADGMKYDCLVPVSGGKDSTYQTYQMKVVHKMNPLAVTFDQFDYTPTSQFNLEVLREIGVDHIHFTMNPKIVRSLVRKGFEIVGDPYWVNHVGIFTLPFKVAVAYKIPLIIYGENSQLEYGGPAADRDRKVFDRRWRQEFGGMRGFREEDMVDDEIKMSDLKSLIFPSDQELKDANVTGLFYGFFHKWDPIKHTAFIKEKLGWKALDRAWAGCWDPNENVDSKFEGIREHLKWIKFGYGRATDQVNIYIRSGKLSRAEGLEIIKQSDGKIEYLEEFCAYTGLSTEEFYRLRDTFVNTDIFEKDGAHGWKLKNIPT